MKRWPEMLKRLLIANRGEIAIRIARAAADLGIESVAVFAEDDVAALHRHRADRAMALPGRGVAAYLDGPALIRLALEADCEAIHPGYGFLSERADFAAACATAGLIFVGPTPEALSLLGDKGRARTLAANLGLPLLPGTRSDASLEEIAAFFDAQPPGSGIMIKAAAGGGGRGMRRVDAREDLAEAYTLAGREARAAFGNEALYAERLLRRARHVEVQIAGDGQDVVSLHDRECTIQRRHQKLIEAAPAIDLPMALRQRLADGAERLARAARYRGLGTVEFLLDADDLTQAAFIEVNPRLQVEHTVTEAVTGLDLVRAQLLLAGGSDLASAGLGRGTIPPPRGSALELRINLETYGADGLVQPAAGRLTRYEPPTGPGIRIDDCGYVGLSPSPSYDPLVAKLIVHHPSPRFADVVAKARRALAEFRIDGVSSNLVLHDAILADPAFAQGRLTTRFVDDNREALARAVYAKPQAPVAAGDLSAEPAPRAPAPPGTEPVKAPLRGTVVALDVAVGDEVRRGATLAILEAMKMQHLVAASQAGRVVRIDIALGETLGEGDALLHIEPMAGEALDDATTAIDLDAVRADLAEVVERHAMTSDARRDAAVARRRRTQQRTARENIDDLFDAGTFNEYGALTLAAQRRRRSLDELIASTPADGMIGGIGSINGPLFGASATRCVGLAYDFTVLAGTQGYFNHKKTDRMLELAEHWQLPVIWFTEGGGGRPGDVDAGQISASSLDTTSFTTFARLSGLAPRISINSGRCFAGNALFFGAADITIATRYSNIGLGGPAMIEGGGLGVFSPDEIGPSDIQWANGTIDLLVEDEAAAVQATKALLACFQGRLPTWTCADQRALRHLIPENRVRAYDIRAVIETLADTGTFIELRGGYGAGMITGFVRIEGRALGLIANNPRHLGGAIDAEGAEKGGRFLQLCDAFDVPVLSLCDTPGFMVGPDSEKTAAVRRGSRLFVTWTSLSVPTFTVVLRKGYGLGAQAMAAGDFSAPCFTVSWPTGEFGPMGLEGAVRLGYKRELDGESDPEKQKLLFEKLVRRMYEVGKAISVASVLEIDAVIDPAETRNWIVRGLDTHGHAPARKGKKRPFVDVW